MHRQQATLSSAQSQLSAASHADEDSCAQDADENFRVPGGKSASSSAAATKAVCQAVLGFVRAISEGALSSCKLHKAADFPEGSHLFCACSARVMYEWLSVNMMWGWPPVSCDA